MDGKSLDTTAEKIAQLRQLFPEAFSEDKIDFQRLKQTLGADSFAKGEHYELSWAGKSEARKEVQKQTTATLIPDSENSIDFDNAQNIFIEGENLEVLRVLQKSYFGKVKMIYIDPPYNTGNDSFVYPDDYAERQDEYKKRTGISNEEGFLNKQELWKKNTKENGQFHSVWLSMMYPRLYLSRNLLREDGVIFISIDDNEASNLKLLCDEVFGEENFVGNFIRRTINSGKQDSTTMSVYHEYLLMYSKSDKLKLNRKQKSEEDRIKLYPLQDKYESSRGKYYISQLDKGSIQYSDSLNYPILAPDNTEIWPGNGFDDKSKVFRWSKEKVKWGIENDYIVFKKQKDGWKVYAKSYEFRDHNDNEINPSNPFTSLDFSSKNYSNFNATPILQKMFNDRNIFDFPKPVIFIRDLINYATNSSDLVLDFFAGSGTTAQAVMELNEEDGGNRRYICVQMPEATDEKSEAYKAGYKTIADITRARIQKVIEKIAKARGSKMDFDNKPLPLCQNYTLVPSNFKTWRGDVAGKEAIAQQLLDFTESQKQGSQAANMLVELCLKSGLGLNVAYQQENGFYKTTLGVWFCFETYTAAMKNEIIAAKPQKLVCLNSCFTSDEVLSNLQLELTENGITFLIV